MDSPTLRARGRGRTRPLLLLSLFALGLGSVMTQLSLMRELLGALYGNELVLGIILGNWFLLTGLGAWVGRSTRGLREPARALVVSQMLVAIIPLAQVFLVRALRNEVFLRGAIVGVNATLVSTFILLLPYCVVSGYMLTLGCEALARSFHTFGPTQTGGWDRSSAAPSPQPSPQGRGRASACPEDHGALSVSTTPQSNAGPGPTQSGAADEAAAVREAATAIGAAYLADTLGSIAGGLLFSFVLIQFLDHFALLCVPAVLNLLLAGAMALEFGCRRLLGLVTAVSLGLLVLVTAVNVDAYSTALQYPGSNILLNANSPYGRLLVTESAGQLSFLENGLPFFSTHDVEQVEETVHYAMVQRPAARRVLLVSGGVSGTAKELLKYPITQVTYAELDPLILAAANRYLPARLADPRIVVETTDGRLLVRQLGRRLAAREPPAAERFDVVILDLPDPSTLQLNRYFTAEFFTEVKSVLTTNGVLSLALGRYENFVGPDLARLLSSAYRTLKEAFPYTLVIPGRRVFFLGSAARLDEDIAARLEQQLIATQFVKRHYLEATLTPDRMADIRRAVEQPSASNRDFNPILYYYHLRHWMSQFQGRSGWLVGLALAVLLAYLCRLRAAPMVLLTAGFAASALEVVLLVAFQILYGSLYRQLGILVALFMAGLAAGAFVASRWLAALGAEDSQAASPVENQRLPARGALTRLAFGLAVYAAPLPWILRGLNGADSGLGSSFVAVAGIAVLTFALAAMVGAQFPLASRVESTRAADTASRLYAADFIGACIGAFLVSTVLIPLLGVTATCWLTGALNAAAGFRLLVQASRP